VNQVLTTTKLYLELSQASPEMKDEMILKASKNIVNVINEIRQLSRSLMNPSIDDLGLMDAINDLIDSVNATKKIFVKLKMASNLEQVLSPYNKLMVYRILQEALNNAMKHSNASNVLIHIKKKEKNIDIIVKDNGIGFNIATVKKGMGLKNIQNRVYLVNGHLKIDSAPGNGCTLDIQIPLSKNLD
jgi:signal transduction histidine kinase